MGTIIPKMGTEIQSSGLAGALFSRVQLRVLSLLIGHPDQSYQLTEVIRLISSGRGAVQRELKKLAKVGILDLLAVGNRKVYKANKKSPIFNELHQLILKTEGLLEPLRNALRRYKSKINAAFVYGSIAKSQDTARSDIDLMIIGRGLAYSDIYATLQKAEKLLLRSINPSLMTPIEWKKKLANKNAFVIKIVDQPKLFIFGTEDGLKGTR
jgi:predicted nucleotidyltransferase